MRLVILVLLFCPVTTEAQKPVSPHLLLMLVLTLCHSLCSAQNIFTRDLVYQEPARLKNEINYLNQTPPGMEARLFAPGIVSSGLSEHSAPAFSPDGNTVLWSVMDKTYRGYLLEMKYNNGSWSKPARPAFADSTADDYYPSFSPDGTKLLFSSRRKVPPGYPEAKDIRLWEVAKTPDGWGKPVPFDTTVSQGGNYAHSITNTGTVYFSTPLSGNTNMNIRKAEKHNGRYLKPALLPFSINSVDYEDGPYVAPDESFLIFESQRPEGVGGSLDLYISFKQKDGRWGLPVNMGPKINSVHAERFAGLSPDGRYLFFGSGRNRSADNWGFDIFWIDAKVIDDLKTATNSQPGIDPELGTKTINALDKNDGQSTAVLLKQWLRLYPNSLDAFVLYSAALRTQKHYTEAEQLLATQASKWPNNTSLILETGIVKIGLKKEEEAERLLAPLLTPGDQLRERYIYLSNALLDMDKLLPSDSYFDKAMALGSGSFPYYRRAVALAMKGHKDRAFAALNKAADLGGYNSQKDYEGDPAFQTLKSDTRWTLLLKKLN